VSDKAAKRASITPEEILDKKRELRDELRSCLKKLSFSLSKGKV